MLSEQLHHAMFSKLHSLPMHEHWSLIFVKKIISKKSELTFDKLRDKSIHLFHIDVECKIHLWHFRCRITCELKKQNIHFSIEIGKIFVLKKKHVKILNSCRIKKMYSQTIGQLPI